jgi:hypothetical protein
MNSSRTRCAVIAFSTALWITVGFYTAPVDAHAQSTQGATAVVDTTERTPVGLMHRDRLPAQPDQVRPEYVLVFISSSTCPVATLDRIPMVQDLIEMHRARAEEENRVFVLQGVALDWDLEAGYEYLQSVAEFDEISIGQSIINEAAFRHMWEDEQVAPATPGLMVMKRDIVFNNESGGRPRGQSIDELGGYGFQKVRETVAETHVGLEQLEEARDAMQEE